MLKDLQKPLIDDDYNPVEPTPVRGSQLYMTVRAFINRHELSNGDEVTDLEPITLSVFFDEIIDLIGMHDTRD